MKYNLERYKTAQDRCYEQVLEEIKNGKKTSHWMWYIFPQITGLGKSSTAKNYEIANIEEAEHYLMDELLSKRLLELTRILAYEVEGKSTEEIFGFTDYLKFHSSMTLFYSVVVTNKQFETNSNYLCFADAIKKYYKGSLDNQTLEILNQTTLFIKETTNQLATSFAEKDDFNFKLAYIDIQPANKWKPSVGNLIIQNKERKKIAIIANAMEPLCWSLDKKIVVTPICKMHWLKGFHQKFAIINFENRTITFLKELYKGGPRILDKVEKDKFHFRHFTKQKKVEKGFVSFVKTEIEETIKF